MRPSKFRPSMITRALQAAEAMRESPIAAQLKINGFHAAVMQEEAEAMTELRTRAVAAWNAALQATADLGERAGEFTKKYASYCYVVRAITTDAAIRRTHGVKSPGVRRGPMFRRGARVENASGVGEGRVTAESQSAPASASDGAHRGTAQ